MISSITALFTLFVFILWYIHNIKEVYRLQLREEQGKPINNFFEELQTYIGSNFHRTLFSSGGMSITFGYAFGKIVSWTFVWAVVATFTCFIGGIEVADGESVTVGVSVKGAAKGWGTVDDIEFYSEK